MKNTFLLFVGSVGLIIAAIVITGVIDFSKSNTKNTEVRAKAANVTYMKLSGMISEYDETSSLVTVDNVKFTETDAKPMGTWKVTYPATFNPSKFPAGSRINIMVNPTQFDISAKTITAAEITR
jgi:hypothetical protein